MAVTGWMDTGWDLKFRTKRKIPGRSTKYLFHQVDRKKGSKYIIIYIKNHKNRADKVQANIRSNSKITERAVTEKKEAENTRRLEKGYKDNLVETGSKAGFKSTGKEAQVKPIRLLTRLEHGRQYTHRLGHNTGFKIKQKMLNKTLIITWTESAEHKTVRLWVMLKCLILSSKWISITCSTK